MAVALAVLGALLVAVGFGLAWLPLGFIVGGAEAVCSAYAVLYLKARRAKP